jgi:adenylate kinase family enzyme
MKRISLIGISGSGKSVYSRELAKETGLPLFHMDQLFWKGDWQEVPEQEYLVEHQKLIERDSWIIEGYIDGKMADRLKRSDIVIFLDYPGWLCAWWVIKRWFQYRKSNRPELAEGANEILKLEFLWRVFRRKERIPLMEALNITKPEKLIIINKPKQLRNLFPDSNF